jgi:hypothetical protein
MVRERLFMGANFTTNCAKPLVIVVLASNIAVPKKYLKAWTRVQSLKPLGNKERTKKT